MIKAKKSGAGHKMYKVCRRVLRNPIVKEMTYCREVKDGKLDARYGDSHFASQGMLRWRTKDIVQPTIVKSTKNRNDRKYLTTARLIFAF